MRHIKEIMMILAITLLLGNLAVSTATYFRKPAEQHLCLYTVVVSTVFNSPPDTIQVIYGTYLSDVTARQAAENAIHDEQYLSWGAPTVDTVYVEIYQECQ